MIRKHALPLFVTAVALATTPLAAKDNLGVYSGWAAFRDGSVPRCYAIAKPEPSKLSRDYEPFVAIGTWPKRNVRGQVHVRLSRKLAKGSSIALRINGRSFALTGGGGDAWAKDKAMDAAIVAAMRSGPKMIVSAIGANGRRFSDSYILAGAATAMDAATVGCARR